jgi:hypothetical protein
MVVIYDIHSNYDENQISLGNPGKLHGGSGSYYTKLFINKELFYFKINSCTTKNGILQTEKKIYTDILFSLLNNDTHYIEWFHQLETTLIDLIYSKSSSWFLSELDKEDINEYFNPVLRQYKTNHNLLRLQLNNKKNIPECIIFDENEEIKTYDDVYEKRFDCIIHIKGIRFTSTSFQLDLELKQILLLEEKDIFKNCILRDNSHASQHGSQKQIPIQSSLPNNDDDCDDDGDEPCQAVSINVSTSDNNDENNNDVHVDSHHPSKNPLYEQSSNINQEEETVVSDKLLMLSNGEAYIEDFENQKEETDDFENKDNIKEYNIEYNLSTKNHNNSVEIREPKEVYKELYEKMIQKAITAKQEYMNAYKHAQFIKREYLGIYEDEYNDNKQYNVKNEEHTDLI